MCAAALMCAGTAGILAAAWDYSWLAGVAVTSVLTLGVGVLLGME